jgi:hypothetical protein
MSFNQRHFELDETIIGFAANQSTSPHYCCAEDGAIVVASEEKCMREWLEQHAPDKAWNIYPITYSGVTKSMYAEGIAFHLDSVSATTFRAVMSRDERFLPELLEAGDAGWTLIFPTTDPFIDDLSELRREVEGFEIGSFDPATRILTGSEELRTQATLTYAEFRNLEKLGVSIEMDDAALGKLNSLIPSLAFLESTEE